MIFKKVSSLIPFDQEALERVSKMADGEEIKFAEITKDPGTSNMLRTWMGWMGQTAAFMVAAGCSMPLYIDSKGVHHGKRPFKGDDAHELFTEKYLGSDENGKRKSWVMSKKGDTVQASRMDRLWAMDRHLEWAAERGIKLTIPRKSEYWELKEEEARAA